MEQLNNVWLKCFSNKDTLVAVASVKNPFLKKYMKRKTKASLFRKVLLWLHFDLVYTLKLDTMHRFIESKKWINIMYVCDYRALFFYHSRLHINSENSNSNLINSIEFSEKKLIFTPVRCYRLSVLVYWYLLLRILVESFVSERLIQSETVTKMGKEDNKNYSKIKIKID